VAEKITDVLERLSVVMEALTPTYDLGLPANKFHRWSGSAGVVRLELATDGRGPKSRWRAFQWRLGGIDPSDRWGSTTETKYAGELWLVVGYPLDPSVPVSGSPVDIEKIQGSDFAIYDRALSRSFPFSNALYGAEMSGVESPLFLGSAFQSRARLTRYSMKWTESAT
jgi:hypothetical protein